MLAIHPDCEEECSVCRHTAEKVEARWALKDSFLENSRNGNPNWKEVYWWNTNECAESNFNKI